MFARLGLVLGTLWAFGTLWRMLDVGTFTPEKWAEIGLIPGGIFVALGVVLSWICAGFLSLFR